MSEQRSWATLRERYPELYEQLRRTSHDVFERILQEISDRERQKRLMYELTELLEARDRVMLELAAAKWTDEWVAPWPHDKGSASP